MASSCATAVYVDGLTPDMPHIPAIPFEMRGRPCIYGYVITDDHRDTFRRLHPDISEWQSYNPKALVSAASAMVGLGRHGATARIFQRGEWRVCLVHADYKLDYPGPLVTDKRRSKEFMAALEAMLGLTGDPQWYLCYEAD